MPPLLSLHVCAFVCVSMTECIPAELSGASHKVERQFLEDVWGLRVDGMQMFLTSTAGKAA